MFKKSVMFIVMLAIMIILIGCESDDTPDPTEIIPDLTEIIPDSSENGYTWVDQQQFLTYHVWSHDGKNIMKDKYMDAHFTEVFYIPFTKKLSFNIVITDKDYRTSDYYLITRKRGSLLTESQVKFRIASASATVHESMGYSTQDEVVVIKVNSKDLNPTTSFEPMATLMIDDEKAALRVYPEGGWFTTTNIYDVNLKSATPYIDFRYRFEDTKRLITSLRLEVYHQGLDAVVATKVIQFTEDMYVNDVVIMEHIKIDGLSPKTNYIVYAYHSGTDGVSTYENIFAFTRNVTSSGIISNSIIVHAMPSLWGVIIDYQLGESATTFNYYLDNSGLVKFENKKVDVVIGVYNQSGEKISEYPIVHGLNSVEIDNQFLAQYYELKFEVLQTKDILSRYTINFLV